MKSTGHRFAALTSAVLSAALLSACGGQAQSAQDRAPTPSASSAADAKPGASRAGSAAEADLAKLPEATTFTTLPQAPIDPARHGATEGEVLHPKRKLAVYDSVAGEAIAALPVSQINSPTWVPVIERRGSWAHILLPTRPNGASGWIDTSGGVVESAQNGYTATVDLSEFRLTVRRDGERIGRYEVGIGKPAHPTPTGRAYIIASIKEQVNDYSPIVLPFSVHSNTHKTFGGGPGTVGIHTWPDDGFLGTARSDGCIRVTGSALRELAKLPLGTIVDIVE